MKAVPIFLALSLALAPVVGAQRSGNVITLDDDELKECSAGDGCYVIPKAVLLKMMMKVHANTLLGCGERT